MAEVGRPGGYDHEQQIIRLARLNSKQSSPGKRKYNDNIYQRRSLSTSGSTLWSNMTDGWLSNNPLHCAENPFVFHTHWRQSNLRTTLTIYWEHFEMPNYRWLPNRFRLVRSICSLVHDEYQKNDCVSNVVLASKSILLSVNLFNFVKMRNCENERVNRRATN